MFYRFIIICACLCALSSCACVSYARLPSADNLSRHEGRRVELAGRVSNTPWQHLMANPDGLPYSAYFDVGDFQIVVYTESPIACRGRMLVRGVVVKVQGSSKEPGAKADESYVEYHLAAESWDCAK